MKYENLIQEAKNKIEEGFDKMDRKIDNPTHSERYLLVSTIKAIEITNAILLLCKNNHVNESLILLRSLIEHSINMAWITNKNSNKRLKEYLFDLQKNKFGNSWSTNRNLKERMKDIGFKNEDYYDYVVKITYSYSHVNASSLDWDKVIKGVPGKNFNGEAVYSIVVQMLGHVIKSLNSQFKGYFNYYIDIWKKIKVDKSDMEKKIKQIFNQFEIKNN